MLPGFVHSTKPSYTFCKTLSSLEQDIKNKEVKEYTEYINKCSNECELFHKKAMLYYQLKCKNICVKLAEECITSDDPLLRYLSIKLLTKENKLKNIVLYLDDSFYKIRKLILRKLYKLKIPVDVEKVKELTFDQNSGVKKLALKYLLSMNYKINERICKLINDKDKEIRIYAAKSIRKLKFNNLKTLFTKSENGVFIYGLEDENKEVRLETIRSIYAMTDASIKDEAFDFLTYILTDEKEELRLEASIILKKLSKKLSWKIPLENLKLLLLTLEEKNKRIVKNVLILCGNLIYSLETLIMFDKIIEKLETGKNKELLYLCIKRIVRGNSELFNIKADKISKMLLKEKKNNKDILDNKYFANLIVLNELNKKGYDFKNKQKFKDDFDFLKIKLFKEKKLSEENYFLQLKRSLIDALHAENINIFKDLFLKNNYDNTFTVFFSELFKGILIYKNNNNLLSINYVLKKYNLENEISNLIELEEIIKNLKESQIKNIFFMINVLESEVKSRKPLDIKIRIATNCEQGYFLRIKDEVSGDKCYFKVKKIVKVYFMIESIENISLCIVKREDYDFLMTKPVKLTEFIK